MGNVIIAVDSGKGQTKIAKYNSDGSVGLSSFDTRVTEGEDKLRSTGLTGKFYTVDYNSKTYTVGKSYGILTTNESSDSKKDDVHRLSILTAIAENTEPGDSVTVGIGAPLSVYQDRVAVNEYLNYIFPETHVQMIVDDKEKDFYINKKKVFAEATGIMYLRPELFTDKTLGVIDIGNLNVNGFVADNLTLRSDMSFTSKLGGVKLINAIQVACNQEMPDLEKPYDFNEVVRGIKAGVMPFDNSGKSKKIIADKVEEHLKAIQKECQKAGWPISRLEYICVGGTSALVADHLPSYFNGEYCMVMDEPEFANAKGFLSAICAMSGIKLKAN